MRVIALTGSVAAGKSSVGALLREMGATVIDVDVLVRELQQPGQPALLQMVQAFGPEILTPAGELDRPVMRAKMLADSATRRQLESIVHPALEIRRQQLLDEARARGDALVIVDIPLLFEAADPARYDGVIVVDAPVAERRRRLIEDRGFSMHDADRLIATQLPASEKRQRATWIVDNDADRTALTGRVRSLWRELHR